MFLLSVLTSCSGVRIMFSRALAHSQCVTHSFPFTYRMSYKFLASNANQRAPSDNTAEVLHQLCALPKPVLPSLGWAIWTGGCDLPLPQLTLSYFQPAFCELKDLSAHLLLGPELPHSEASFCLFPHLFFVAHPSQGRLPQLDVPLFFTFNSFRESAWPKLCVHICLTYS